MNSFYRKNIGEHFNENFKNRNENTDCKINSYFQHSINKHCENHKLRRKCAHIWSQHMHLVCSTSFIATTTTACISSVRSKGQSASNQKVSRKVVKQKLSNDMSQWYVTSKTHESVTQHKHASYNLDVAKTHEIITNSLMPIIRSCAQYVRNQSNA